MKIAIQLVLLAITLLSTTSSALSDYSPWLESLLKQRSVAVKANAKISRPYAGATEYEITSRPDIAKVIEVSLRDKNSRYWTIISAIQKRNLSKLPVRRSFHLFDWAKSLQQSALIPVSSQAQSCKKTKRSSLALESLHPLKFGFTLENLLWIRG
ncbi:MAG: hypothetical protein HC933_08130 [Pleurocapsa sp. SU_196_0]|nr:hypothetical protein [Pleurocapsa sp. SU_196_0]